MGRLLRKRYGECDTCKRVTRWELIFFDPENPHKNACKDCYEAWLSLAYKSLNRAPPFKREYLRKKAQEDREGHRGKTTEGLL